MSLHVESLGSGPDLVLVHGWAMHGGVWDGVRGDLARDFTVHVVDLPGHGRSAPLREPTLPRLVQVLTGAVPEGAALCGWSFGAQVAMGLALAAPGRVSRLILVAATPCFVQRPDWPSAVTRQALEEFAADLARDYEGTLRRFLALQARGGDAARGLIARLRAGFFDRGRPDPETLRDGLGVLLETDIRAAVGSIELPVLLIHGEHDLLAPADAARWLASRLPHASLMMVPHCAHAPFLSHPGEFTAAAREFLPHG